MTDTDTNQTFNFLQGKTANGNDYRVGYPIDTTTSQAKGSPKIVESFCWPADGQLHTAPPEYMQHTGFISGRTREAQPPIIYQWNTLFQVERDGEYLFKFPDGDSVTVTVFRPGSHSLGFNGPSGDVCSVYKGPWQGSNSK